jgi:hypothetical protein
MSYSARPPAARTLSIALLIALSIVMCAACAPKRAPKSVFDTEAVNPDSVIVRVVSQYDGRVAVYAERDSGTVRFSTLLGEVAARGEGRFPLRAADVTRQRMTLAATPVGGRAHVQSVPVRVQRGQVVLFTITPDLVGSQLRVRWPREP